MTEPDPVVRRPKRRPFTLDRFLKYEGVAETGGMAKQLVQAGEVRVNGVVETRRRRQLTAGDVVELLGERLVVPGAPGDSDQSESGEGSPA